MKQKSIPSNRVTHEKLEVRIQPGFSCRRVH
nr:MAG TPA: hypothetical protein [Caudoviricetes sp.]